MPTESDISSEFDLLAERGGFTSSEESEEFSDRWVSCVLFPLNSTANLAIYS